MTRPYHIYQCIYCFLTFAIEMVYEDQSMIRCPDCQLDEGLIDVGHGQMTETLSEEVGEQ